MQISNQSNKPSFSGVFNMKGHPAIPSELHQYAVNVRDKNGYFSKYYLDGDNIRFSVVKKFDKMVKQILNNHSIEYKYDDIHGVKTERILEKVI